MLNITQLCKNYNNNSIVPKFPCHFTSKKCCKEYYNEIEITQGPFGVTMIPEHLAPDFVSWLSPEYATRIKNGEGWREVIREIE